MAVLKRHVPEPINIKDYREQGGVFYEAKCEQCGRIFYPKRGTAKYCSKQCGIEFRNGGILEKNEDKKPNKIRERFEEKIIEPKKKYTKLRASLDKIRAQKEATERKKREKRVLAIAKKYADKKSN
jgi:uncharacterized Zn finger protein (UPF0148 family)